MTGAGATAGATPTEGGTTRVDAAAWRALALVSAAMFTIILDNNGVNVAFPYIERTFDGTPRSTLAWVSTGYSIVLAALLLVSGRVADRQGRRRVFLAGMAVFTVASIGTALAPGVALLIAARAVQGTGAAMMTATGVALILPLFPPARRGFAVGIWGTVGSAGAAAGPTLGALAIEAFSWRWVFLINVPIAAVVLLLGRRLIPADTPSDDAGRPIDAIGTVVGTAGVGALTFAVLQGPRWGWTSSGVGIAAAACVVLLAWFFLRCARSENPLLDLSLFRHRPFATANLSQAGTQMAIFSWFFTTPLFLINVWEYSAFAGGSAVAIGMLISFVSIPVGKYSDRAGYRHVLVAGGVVTAAGMVWWLLFVGETPNYVVDYLPGLFLFGVGAGMVGIVVTNAALAGLPEASLASANAVFQTIRRLLGAIGVALAVALLGGDRTTDSVEAFRRTWWLVAGGYLFSLVGALAYPPGERRRRAS